MKLWRQISSALAMAGTLDYKRHHSTGGKWRPCFKGSSGDTDVSKFRRGL